MNKLRRYASSLTIGIPLAYGLIHVASGCQTVVGAGRGFVRDVKEAIRFMREPLYNESKEGKSVSEEYNAHMEEEVKAFEAERKQKESELEETAQEE